ncbi:MAG: hypothetical protein ABEJ91_02470 [Candidatus Nanohaloarchaea archaeon]
MSGDIEQQYGLESVDPKIEAMLTGDDTGGDQQVRCLFDIDTENGSANPYAELNEILDEAGYSGASQKGRMNMASASLDREGIEIALRQPYVTAVRLDVENL